MLLASAKCIKRKTPGGEKWDNRNGEPIASLRRVPKGKERSFTRECIIDFLKEARKEECKFFGLAINVLPEQWISRVCVEFVY